VFLVLGSDMEENFLKKTGKNDSFTYMHEYTNIVSGQRIQRKRQISAREFIEI